MAEAAQLGPGDAIPSVSLLRTDAGEVALGDLIAGRPTVFFFLRHYA
jgi:hypothetical protein